MSRVLISATSEEKANAFATWIHQTTGLEALLSSPEETSSADMVAACTTSATPVVVADRVRQGAHVNAVGAFTPTTRELPSALMARARVYVDTRAGALSEAGDLVMAAVDGTFALHDLVGEIGEAVLGEIPGRRSASEVTVYKSVGAAFLDAATARLAFEQAVRQAAGSVYEFSSE